jgi:hypothetical protein
MYMSITSYRESIESPFETLSRLPVQISDLLPLYCTYNLNIDITNKGGQLASFICDICVEIVIHFVFVVQTPLQSPIESPLYNRPVGYTISLLTNTVLSTPESSIFASSIFIAGCGIISAAGFLEVSSFALAAWANSLHCFLCPAFQCSPIID